MSRLKQEYKNNLVPKIKKELNLKSVMQVPKLVKICINQGLGKAVNDKKLINISVDEMTAISGQKAVPTVAKKSISNFKLREGMVIGVKVTLRGDKMYDFFDRLVSLALPRVRDFRGVSTKSFDGRNSYTLGVKEQIIFPEISIDKINKLSGMDITVVTSAKNKHETHTLLKHLGMPFTK